MPVSADTLRLLVSAGIAGDALVAIVASIDRDMDAVAETAEERTARQERNRRYYQSRKQRLNSDGERLNSDDLIKTPERLKASEKRLNGSRAHVEDNLLPLEIAGKKENRLSVHSDAKRLSDFEELWSVFPRREGSNPKKPALLAFGRAVARGSPPETIIAAAKALAREHPAPTRFVPQTVTWLNQDRFMDTSGPGPPEPMRFKTVEEIFAEVEAEKRAEREKNSGISGAGAGSELRGEAREKSLL